MEMGGGLDPNLLLAQLNKGDQTDDKFLYLLLFLLFEGKKGFGGGDGEGVRSASTLADLNAMQTALQQALVAQTNSITERTLDITRDQATNAFRTEAGQARLAMSIESNSTIAQLGQKDLVKQICECCCTLGIGIKDVENAICAASAAATANSLQTQNMVQFQGQATQNAIDKCCCENKNAILEQTHVLSTVTRDEGAATRALLTDNRMQDLQNALNICRDENSNLRQTEVLSAQIRDTCGSHHRRWGGSGDGNGNGNGGNGGTV